MAFRWTDYGRWKDRTGRHERERALHCQHVSSAKAAAMEMASPPAVLRLLLKVLNSTSTAVSSSERCCPPLACRDGWRGLAASGCPQSSHIQHVTACSKLANVELRYSAGADSHLGSDDAGCLQQGTGSQTACWGQRSLPAVDTARPIGWGDVISAEMVTPLMAHRSESRVKAHPVLRFICPSTQDSLRTHFGVSCVDGQMKRSTGWAFTRDLLAPTDSVNTEPVPDTASASGNRTSPSTPRTARIQYKYAESYGAGAAPDPTKANALSALTTPLQDGCHRAANGLDVALRSLKPPASTASAKPDESLSNEQRLGDVVWKPEHEFPGRSVIDRHAMTLDRELQVLRRIARVSVRSIAQPARLALLGVCSSGVLGLSAYEAHLLLDPAQPATLDSLVFVYTYATHNFLASCIWETRAPALVAQALGLDPAGLLRVFDPATSTADAALQLKIMSVFTTRAMLAGFMVVTQLLNIVRASGTAALGYLENVYSGLEPPLQGIEERIIRLAGKGSDVTEVSMARYGAHILPVFEDPEQHRHLVAQWSLNGRVPCVWCVPKGQYGFRHSWTGLRVDESFLLRTTTGKYILCIEADATLKDRAFELRVMPKSPLPKDEELSIEEASQAYRLVERQAALALQRPFRSLCVLLGDSRQPCDLGGESFVSLRERMRLKQEVNVLIDSKAPLLLEVLKWCGRFVDDRKTLVLDVTPHNFTPLKLFLEHHGYAVLTPAEAVEFEERERAELAAEAKIKAEAEEQEQRQRQDQEEHELALAGSLLKGRQSDPSLEGSKKTCENTDATEKNSDAQDKATMEAKDKPTGKDHEKGSNDKENEAPAARRGKKPEKLPRLLYYPTTSATINAVHATLTSGDGLSDPRRCCVLINQPFGLEHLDELAQDAGQKFHPVCAAEIYDDYFRQVRIWTRMGHSAAVIQRELDQRFEPVRDVLDAIATLDKASTSPRSK
ncbi:unnamed protein product [Phytophthora fragariaefolia]|uniref:Unnamed protein product n=1 Tax=Phytophthora fragariaefolia TaxID=1490495 RepID=A0A9W6XXT3_9STRA|nr:unnamed protein product [Phytophthora fragariaefolia]